MFLNNIHDNNEHSNDIGSISGYFQKYFGYNWRSVKCSYLYVVFFFTKIARTELLKKRTALRGPTEHENVRKKKNKRNTFTNKTVLSCAEAAESSHHDPDVNYLQTE